MPSQPHLYLTTPLFRIRLQSLLHEAEAREAHLETSLSSPHTPESRLPSLQRDLQHAILTRLELAEALFAYETTRNLPQKHLDTLNWVAQALLLDRKEWPPTREPRRAVFHQESEGEFEGVEGWVFMAPKKREEENDEGEEEGVGPRGERVGDLDGVFERPGDLKKEDEKVVKPELQRDLNEEILKDLSHVPWFGRWK